MEFEYKATSWNKSLKRENFPNLRIVTVHASKVDYDLLINLLKLKDIENLTIVTRFEGFKVKRFELPSLIFRTENDLSFLKLSKNFDVDEVLQALN